MMVISNFKVNNFFLCVNRYLKNFTDEGEGDDDDDDA